MSCETLIDFTIAGQKFPLALALFDKMVQVCLIAT
ncbi:protein of unknown function [Hyphomicrobium sp. MC1]|nr:protein of unknown function [Hyphomicrobium sp. MC1]